jgi:energy-coupling factor transport system ATP-binding protein
LFFELDQVTFHHPGLPPESTPALKNVTLRIAEGEWVALVGANGSGKTTLARHLNGIFIPESGKVLVDGKDTREPANLAGIRASVGMVFQSPEDQIVASLVREDTAFGPENLAVLPDEIRSRIEASLKTVGMWELRDRLPHLLSAGQIQRVALAGVLAMHPRCIIFDETTAMLDPRGKSDVMDQMKLLHKQGITVIMITHSMDEAAWADRAVLLDHGEIAFDGQISELFLKEDLLKQCALEQPSEFRVKKILASQFPNHLMPGHNINLETLQIPTYSGNAVLKKGTSDSSEMIVEIKDLGHTYLSGTPMASVSLQHTNLTVRKHIAHGLVGATGSGKSTLLQHLNGLYLPQTGSVRVGPFSTGDPKVDLRALRQFSGLVFQNPELYFFEQYVGDEIAFGAKQYFGRENLRQRVIHAMGLVGLDFEKFKDRIPNTLSGGEKRKVALASALVVNPELLVLDEPSAGLDPQSRQLLLHNLQQLQVDGHSIVISSHNMEDIAALASEMTIMKAGTSIASGNVGELFSDAGQLQEAGLSQPVGVTLANALRRQGWPISMQAVSLDQVESSLKTISEGISA